jgi:AraC-like DNA-binding protein
MEGSGSALFTDANACQANMPAATRLLVTRAGKFSARLTWVELTELRLMHARETLPRITYGALPPEWVFIGFPTHRTSSLICGGAQLQMGDIIFQGVGERMHQRTAAATTWGSIALTPVALRAYGKTLAGRDIAPPSFGEILRPPALDRRQLLRLHAEAIRIAETKLSHIGCSEVARAVDQDLIWALIACLTTAERRGDSAIRCHQASVMVQFEEALMARPGRPLHVSEIRDAIGVSERMLEICCFEVLGMEPAQYLHLCILDGARRALVRANSTAESDAEVTKRYGFTDLDHFLTEFRSAFGELPHINPRHAAHYRN